MKVNLKPRLLHKIPDIQVCYTFK